MEAHVDSRLLDDDSTDADWQPRHWQVEQSAPSSLTTATPDSIRLDAHVLQLARRVVSELFGEREERGFTVRYWTALEERGFGTPTLPFTFVLRSSGALRRMLVPPTETRLAEAFLHGDFDVDGSLESATALAARIAERLHSPTPTAATREVTRTVAAS